MNNCVIKNEIEHIINSNLESRVLKRFGFFDLFSFWKRTPEQIIGSQSFSSTFACLDKAIVVGYALQKVGYDTSIRIDRIFLDKDIIGLHFILFVEKNRSGYSIDLRALRNIIIKNKIKQSYYSNLLLPIKGQKKMKFVAYKTYKLLESDINKEIGKILEIYNWLIYFKITKYNSLKYWFFYLTRFGKKAHNKIVKINNIKSSA